MIQRNSNSNSRISSLPSEYLGLLIAAVLMILFGWGGLYVLITNTLPRIGGELWMFFVLLQIAITGVAIPIVQYLNVRFTPISKEVPSSGVILRQSIWIGLFGVICAWLQIPRVLSAPIMLLLAVVFFVIELYLRYRDSVER